MEPVARVGAPGTTPGMLTRAAGFFKRIRIRAPTAPHAKAGETPRHGTSSRPGCGCGRSAGNAIIGPGRAKCGRAIGWHGAGRPGTGWSEGGRVGAWFLRGLFDAVYVVALAVWVGSTLFLTFGVGPLGACPGAS